MPIVGITVLTRTMVANVQALFHIRATRSNKGQAHNGPGLEA
jgi:hypothetical protein